MSVRFFGIERASLQCMLRAEGGDPDESTERKFGSLLLQLLHQLGKTSETIGGWYWLASRV